MVKDTISCIKSIKSSKKILSWSKNLEDIKIISPYKKFPENNENIDKNKDYQDILKLKIIHLRKKIQNEIDLERIKYIQDKIDLYLLKIIEENLFYLDI